MSGGESFDPLLRFGDYLGPLLTILFFCWFIVAGGKARRRRNRPDCVPDRPDIPYQVFTRAFDEVVRADDIGRVLSASGAPYPQGIKVTNWPDRIEQAESAWADAEARLGESRFHQTAEDGAAIVILIDQSGSNKDRMPLIAGAVGYGAAVLQKLGYPFAVFGFTTVGWRGGAAFQAWKGAGQKPYPGRVCALRHIIYKDFDDPSLDRADWITLCHPGALHENVDGEALEWAAAELRSRPDHRKMLIHISDGVPMDDATAAHNGPNYLGRHYHEVIEGLKSEGLVTLVTILVVDSEEEVRAEPNRATPERLPDAIFAAAGVQVQPGNLTASSVD